MFHKQWTITFSNSRVTATVRVKESWIFIFSYYDSQIIKKRPHGFTKKPFPSGYVIVLDTGLENKTCLGFINHCHWASKNEMHMNSFLIYHDRNRFCVSRRFIFPQKDFIQMEFPLMTSSAYFFDNSGKLKWLEKRIFHSLIRRTICLTYSSLNFSYKPFYISWNNEIIDASQTTTIKTSV